MISGAAVAAQNRLGKELLIQAESWFLLVTGCVLGLHWGIVGVAYGILPSIVYLSLRLSRLANRCLNADLRDLVNCLKPALLLNTSMSILLFITSSLLPDSLHSAQPVLYMLIMGGIGGLSYTLLFLYAPIPALATESLRWRRRLHLIAE
jgi:hypothetical protein